jgi:hypothetical protein
VGGSRLTGLHAGSAGAHDGTKISDVRLSWRLESRGAGSPTRVHQHFRPRTKISNVRLSWRLESGAQVPHEGASRCGALSVVQTDTGSGNTVEKAHTKRSEKAGSGSERIRDMNMRPGGIEGARTRGGPPREEDGGRQNLNKPDRRP